MQLTHLLIYFVSFLFLELLYFRIADYFNIIDKPNHRSSHTSITLRGGGIIFCLAVLVYAITHNFPYPYFILGLLCISIISFLDDVITLNNKIRLAVHLLSTFLLFVQLDLFSLPWYWLMFAFIFIIATINAYNFMDGINGLTGGYSFLTIATLYYINEYIVEFVSSELLIIVGLSLIVFNFFNFRSEAKCFAGDVGSVSIAFIVIFLIGSLILTTKNLNFVLLLLVYGVDTAFTVFFRKLRGENIFKAHRSHFYQFLTNQLKYPHVLVSVAYVLVQLLINVLIIKFIDQTEVYSIGLFAIVIALYLMMRFKLEGRNKLLSKYESN
jgi:UDP-N-acetylmuramyl pentapeptide phosphotransferase/UDP-N-acetylglucosamine-1-phosphate transferase